MQPPAPSGAGERPPAAWRRLGIRHLWFLLPWVGVVRGARLPISDNSLLWHIRAGTLQAGQGEVLRADPFSYTFHGSGWRTQSWLADLLYGWLEGLAGLAWVQWELIGAGMAMFTLLGIAVYRRTGSAFRTGLALGVTMVLGLGFLVPRPVIFSYVLLSLLILALDDDRLRWAIPLVVWLWASVHGSFVIGLGLIALDGLRRARPARLVDLAASAVTASLTAHGLAVWWVLLQFFGSRGALDLIQEWAPPNLTEVSGIPYLIIVGALLYGAVRGRLTARDLSVVVPFVTFGLTAERALFPAVLVLVPFAASAFPPARPAASRSTGLPVDWVLAVVMLVLPFFLGDEGAQLDREVFPVAAAQTLETDRVFHDDAAGGYLIYAQWPDRPVFVDDRAELYGEAFFRRYAAVRFGQVEPGELFEEFGVEEALLRQSDPARLLLADRGWSITYEDDEFLVMRPG